MTQIILIMTFGRNLYDHNQDVEHEVRYEQASRNTETMEMYNAHARRTFEHSRIAWFAMNELNVTTGENKQIFYKAKPLQQRLEVNVAAKKAKVIKAHDEWQTFSATPISMPNSAASVLAQIAAMQNDQAIMAALGSDQPENPHDF